MENFIWNILASRRANVVVSIFTMATLGAALFSWSYGYYLFLHLLVFVAGIYCSLALRIVESNVLATALFIYVFIFDVLASGHNLTRETWSFVDGMGATLFGFTAYRLYSR